VNLHAQEHNKYGRLPEKVPEKFRVRRGDVLIVRSNANPDLVGKAGMIDRFRAGCLSMKSHVYKPFEFRHR
jgi:hypothetical protein